MRLIDADALIKVLEIFLKDHKTILAKRLITNLIAIIDNQTGIEAKPVVHAHWVDVNPNLHIGMKCSLCGARIKYSEFFNGNHRYCHKCGAQMDEVVE